MKIEDARMGDLVKNNHGLYGFIVGISENNLKEPVLVVQWQTGISTTKTHPTNVRKIVPSY